jgi:hypothetical protein
MDYDQKHGTISLSEIHDANSLESHQDTKPPKELRRTNFCPLEGGQANMTVELGISLSDVPIGYSFFHIGRE